MVVRVRYPRELRANPTDLKEIYVPVEKGSPVPLSELATLDMNKVHKLLKVKILF